MDILCGFLHVGSLQVTHIMRNRTLSALFRQGLDLAVTVMPPEPRMSAVSVVVLLWCFHIWSWGRRHWLPPPGAGNGRVMYSTPSLRHPKYALHKVARIWPQNTIFSGPLQRKNHPNTPPTRTELQVALVCGLFPVYSQTLRTIPWLFHVVSFSHWNHIRSSRRKNH